MLNLEENPPDFVNEAGVKWWLDKFSTIYAEKKIKGAKVWLIEDTSGFKTRVVLKDDNIIVEDQTIEGLGHKIDMYSIVNKFDQE